MRRSNRIVCCIVVAAAVAAAPVRGQEAMVPEVHVVGVGPTTLLTIPCGSCRWRSFDEFAERNAERYTTVAVTLPGYGGTPLPPLPSFGPNTAWHQYAVDALSNLIDELDLRDIVVVGHSFGASIAAQLVSRRAARVRGFVALDATLAAPLERSTWTRQQRLEAAESIREEYMRPLADLDAWQAWNTPSIERPERRLLYHGWFMDTDRTAVEQYWWDNLLIDRNAVLESLRVPVLDVQLHPAGTNPGPSRDRYRARIDALDLDPRYRVLDYEGVGHFVMEDAPGLLDRIIAEFTTGSHEYPSSSGR